MKAIQVTGKDSADFLHRVTSGTVRGLAVGEGAAGALLTGQSRMIAQFDLLRNEAGYLLATPDACAEALLQGLENLHFAEDLSIALLSECVNLAKTGAPKRGAKFSVTGQAWPALVPGYECRIEKERRPLPENFHFDRIGALIPFSEDWENTTPALEAGMLPFIDRFKGCYPGQEVVERSLNVGHPARVLIAIEGNSPLTRGSKLPFEGGGEALVTSVAESSGIFRALARVPWAKRETAPAGFRALKPDLA